MMCQLLAKLVQLLTCPFKINFIFIKKTCDKEIFRFKKRDVLTF